MESGYLIDSNAIIELLGATLPEPGLDFLEEIVSQGVASISIINKIEVLGY